jgi:hypothetical protein
MNLKEHKHLHFESTCQILRKEIKRLGSGNHRRCHQATFFVSYEGRQIPKFRGNVGKQNVRPKCGQKGNFRMGSLPAILMSVLKRGREISEFFCKVKRHLYLHYLKN